VAAFGEVGGEFGDEELLDDVLDGAEAGADGESFKGKGGSVAVGGGIVGVGDAAGGEGADDAGVVELPVLVVAAADDAIGEGVEEAGVDAAGALVEVARILLEEDGEDGIGEDVVCEEGAVGGGVALAIAGGSELPGEVVRSQFFSCGDAGEREGDGIDEGFECEGVFLAGRERDGVGIVADVEVGNDAEDALLFFLGDLDVALGGADLDVGSGAGMEGDGVELAGFAGEECAGDLAEDEAGSGDGEGEGAGGNSREVEAAVGSCEGGEDGAGAEVGRGSEGDAGLGGWAKLRGTRATRESSSTEVRRAWAAMFTGTILVGRWMDAERGAKVLRREGW